MNFCATCSRSDGACIFQTGEVVLQPRGAQGFEQTAPSGPKEAVKVTLHDCLACSGCVTSAETILLEQQSVDELLARLSDPKMHVVVSVSPQSRASLAAFYGLEAKVAFWKLTGLLKALGARCVLDTAASRDLSLLETAQEFVQRYRLTQGGSNSHGSSSVGKGMARFPCQVCKVLLASQQSDCSVRELIHIIGVFRACSCCAPVQVTEPIVMVRPVPLHIQCCLSWPQPVQAGCVMLRRPMASTFCPISALQSRHRCTVHGFGEWLSKPAIHYMYPAQSPPI